jgi:hypothetical protein
MVETRSRSSATPCCSPPLSPPLHEDHERNDGHAEDGKLGPDVTQAVRGGVGDDRVQDSTSWWSWGSFPSIWGSCRRLACSLGQNPVPAMIEPLSLVPDMPPSFGASSKLETAPCADETQ